MSPSPCTLTPGDGTGWPGQLRFWTHDLINTACGLRELLQLVKWPADDQETCDLLQTASAQLVEELRALHAIVHGGPGEFTPHFAETTVADLLDGVRASCCGFAGLGSRQLRITGASALLLITDIGLLRRALVNLVRNALAASPPGGTVTLSAATDPSALHFAVHNPGVIPPGLDPSHPAVSCKGPGHGLGLFGVGTIVRRHLDGELLLASDPEHGTTCSIVLPRRIRIEADSAGRIHQPVA